MQEYKGWIILGAVLVLIFGGLYYLSPVNNTSNSNNYKNESNNNVSTTTEVAKQIDSDIINQLMNMQNTYKTATIKTNKGDIVIEFKKDTPMTVNNFVKLAGEKFYDGVKFHRIIKDFMIQTGDPNTKNDNAVNTWGMGGPGYKFPDETKPTDNMIYGDVAMANAGPGTNGSQFFIVTKEDGTSWLNGHHTIFAHVIKGMDVAMAIEGVKTGDMDRPLTPVVINSIELK